MIWQRGDATTLRDVKLTGLFVAFHHAVNAPIVVTINDEVFVPPFTTRRKMHEVVSTLITGRYRIRQINNARDFIESVRGKRRVMIDPHTTALGNTQFSELAFPR
jgi:hypothetical protein